MSSTQPAGQTASSAAQVSTSNSGVDCCIVGAGPAGAVLALLLARKGLTVELLEAHGDFDRQFRGDTIHPSVMEIMDKLGLADRLLEIPHGTISDVTVNTRTGSLRVADFRKLPTRFPYITMLPQAKFLEFITTEAARYPGFSLRLGANVHDLIQEDGRTLGVRYRDRDTHVEVRARLIIGADGRFSRLRSLGDFEMVKTSPPMDVLWFTLPREAGDPHNAQGIMDRGRLVVILDRDDYWQIGYVIPKGRYRDLHDAGIQALRDSFAEVAPHFADRVGRIEDWRQIAVLSVESSRVKKWWRPGLLLIGDAAHVMTPVGGVGINYAIHDAVAAASILTGPLQQGAVSDAALAEFQRKRELPIRVVQAVQALAQKKVISPALSGSLDVPDWLRLILSFPIVQQLIARAIGFGIGRPHLDL